MNNQSGIIIYQTEDGQTKIDFVKSYKNRQRRNLK
jgi:hypothetical protein